MQYQSLKRFVAVVSCFDVCRAQSPTRVGKSVCMCVGVREGAVRVSVGVRSGSRRKPSACNPLGLAHSLAELCESFSSSFTFTSERSGKGEGGGDKSNGTAAEVSGDSRDCRGRTPAARERSEPSRKGPFVVRHRTRVHRGKRDWPRKEGASEGSRSAAAMEE